jgi:hypothetical protein
MKLKCTIAALLAATAFSATAANQTFNVTPGVALNFDGLGPLLSSADHSDTLTFTGLAAGTYSVFLSYSSVNVDLTKASLNDDTPILLFHTPSASLGTFAVTDQSPFTLKLWGAVTGNPIGASYNGQIVVTAVPEPATYGMLLGGLGLLGYAARRRKNQA